MTLQYQPVPVELRNLGFEEDETASISSQSTSERVKEHEPKTSQAVVPDDELGLLQDNPQDEPHSTIGRNRRRIRYYRQKFATWKTKFTIWQRQHGFTGWRFSLALSAMLASLIFILNFVFLIVVIARAPMDDGIATLFQGSCSKATNTSTGIHIAINIISSLLLGSSNFCMQCLIAPTRSEVDRAHAKGHSLDIGVSSIRNLKWVHWQRILMWSVLAISSLPLHLLYNSVVFNTLGANQYNVTAFGEISFQIGPQPYPIFSYNEQGENKVELSGGPKHQSATLFQNLTITECTDIYGSSGYVTNVSNVLLVSSGFVTRNGSDYVLLPESSANHSLAGYPVASINASSIDFDDPQSWMSCRDSRKCLSNWSQMLYVASDGNSNTTAEGFRESQDIAVYAQVSYCLAQVTPETCQLQMSVHILVLVIVCNVLKLICFLTTIWELGQDTFMVVGDAVASYLESPDASTAENCLASKHEGPFSRKKRGKDIWKRRRRFWWQSPRLFLCVIWVILCATSLAFAISLYNTGALGDSLKDQWSLGFGRVSADYLVNLPVTDENAVGTAGLIAMVLLANTPQLIVSSLYVVYNNLYTAMLLAKEWSGYARHRRYLRVTSPSGNQRSTYYLHLPYRYGIPLMVAMIILHWLIAQSLFLVRVRYVSNGVSSNSDPAISRLGYSLVAILFSILGGSSMIATLIGLGFRRYPPSMPLAASDSAAISAACHPPKDDLGASEKKVMWGEVLETVGECEPGHCSFTSKEVHAPVQGRQYR